MRVGRVVTGIGSVALLSLCLASGALAQPTTDSERARQAYALSSELMSPFCPGRTLSDCPSPDAAAWRDQIRTWVDAGVPPAEIRARLQAQSPIDLSPLPRDRLGRVGPWLLIALGAGVLVAVLRRLIRAQPAQPAEPAPVDPQIEAELRQEFGD